MLCGLVFAWLVLSLAVCLVLLLCCWVGWWCVGVVSVFGCCALDWWFVGMVFALFCDFVVCWVVVFWCVYCGWVWVVANLDLGCLVDCVY